MKYNLSDRVGNTLTKYPFDSPFVIDSSYIDFDFYFMATRLTKGSDQISLIIWVVLIDDKGGVYCTRTKHLGHFEPWKEVIKNKIIAQLHKVRLSDVIPRVLSAITITKENHLLKKDYRIGGNNIGIDGSDTIHIRKAHLMRFEL